MSSVNQIAENKLLILFLVEKSTIPLTNSDITQFSVERNFMDYFTVQSSIAELIESGLLNSYKENNTIRYSVTDNGREMLSLFIRHISEYAKDEVNSYISENGQRIKAEFEITANYFLELNNEYTVKCGVYDSDATSLMEISANVATKEQAKIICANWKENVSVLYGKILNLLAGENL